MYRAWYAARLKSGLIRAQLPATTWEAQPLSRFLSDASLADPQAYAAHRQTLAPRFFFDSQQIQHFRSSVPQWDTDEISPLTQASEVHQGRFRFFSHERVEVGLPPRWNVDPVTNHAFPDDRHWSQIGDFEAGDIKLVWETNRFGFVFPLVRSYWRRGNEQDAELFWQLVESWHAAKRPVELHAYEKGGHGFGAGVPATSSSLVLPEVLAWLQGRGLLTPANGAR